MGSSVGPGAEVIRGVRVTETSVILCLRGSLSGWCVLVFWTLMLVLGAFVLRRVLWMPRAVDSVAGVFACVDSDRFSIECDFTTCRGARVRVVLSL